MDKKTLRPHQQQCVDALRESVSRGEIPYADCTVGFGKSLVMAEITNLAMRKGIRVLQITPSKELCSQNFEETYNHLDDKNKDKLGIVCAGLNKSQQSRQAVICTYGSMLKRRASSGEFGITLIDECHILSHNEDTSIRKIIKSLYRLNPNMIVMGLSGSPYRANSGALENDCVDGKAFFTECAYTSNIRELMESGYLSHIENISGDIQADMDGVPMSGSDYNTELMSVKFDAILRPAVADMKVKFNHYGIKTAVIYTSNIKNAEHVIEEWGESDEIRILHGGVSNSERSETLEWLKNGKGNRYVVNVALLITGYNQPSLEAVVFFRATKSLVIYCQSIGRCLRAHSDKVRSYCICYGGNIDRHGAIDSINPPKPKKRRGDLPKKLCDITLDKNYTDKEGVIHYSGYPCNTSNILSAKFCSTCGAKFISDSEDGSYQMRSRAMLLSDKMDNSIIEYDVAEVEFEIVKSHKNQLLMIKMKLYTASLDIIHQHYICLDHAGKAQQIAKSFLRKLFKNQTDYYKLGSVGLSVTNISTLLMKHYNTYFRKIISVKIGDQKGNSKYKEVKSMTFEK